MKSRFLKLILALFLVCTSLNLRIISAEDDKLNDSNPKTEALTSANNEGEESFLSISEAIKKELNSTVKIKAKALFKSSGAFGGKGGFYVADSNGDVIYVFSDKKDSQIKEGVSLSIEGTLSKHFDTFQIQKPKYEIISEEIEVKETKEKLSAIPSRDNYYISCIDEVILSDHGEADNYGNRNITIKEGELELSARFDTRNITKGNINKFLKTAKEGSVINLCAVVARYNSNIQLQLHDYNKLVFVREASAEINPKPNEGENEAAPAESKYQKLANIGTLQGAAHYSPYRDKDVRLENVVVTRVINDRSAFIQDLNPDNDPKTSDGVMLSKNKNQILKVGDVISVEGRVEEFANTSPSYQDSAKINLPLTQVKLDNFEVIRSNENLPKPVLIKAIPNAVAHSNGLRYYVDSDNKFVFDPLSYSADYYESLEGMLIKYEKPHVIAPQRYGDIYVVADSHKDVRNHFGGINLSENGRSPYILQIHVDRNGRNETGIITKPKDYFKNDVVGVMTYGFQNYYLLTNIDYLKAEDNINETKAVGSGFEYYLMPGDLEVEKTTLKADKDHLLIASYNIENFSTKTNKNKVQRLAETITTNLAKPDIIVVSEMQDDDGSDDSGTVSAKKSAAKLITAIKEIDSNLEYEYIDVEPVNNMDGGAPGSNIRVGFLYNPKRVSLVDPSENIDNNLSAKYENGKLNQNPVRIDPSNEVFTNSRKPIVGLFKFNGEKIMIIGNHLSSKRGDDPIYGKVQPAINHSEAARIKQASVTYDFIKDVKTSDPTLAIVLAGDFNDHEWTKTIKTIEGDLFTNLLLKHDEKDRFTYSYQGSNQSLDNIIVSNDLLAKTSFDVVHLNSMYMTNHGRASDHDPLLAQIRFDSIKTLTNPNTKISLTYDSNIHNKNLKLVSSIVTKIDGIDLNKYNLKAYDILVLDGNGNKANLSEKVSISIPLDISTKNLKLKLLKDNKHEDVEFKIVDNKVTFESKDFSIYYLISEKSTLNTETKKVQTVQTKVIHLPDTGVSDNLSTLALAMLISSTYLIIKKKEN